jgi:GNAT superfamily N-acetyltransferase
MSHLHIGDVVWQFPGSQPKDNIRLWFDDDRLVGYAWFQPPDVIRFDVDPTLPKSLIIRNEALAWATTRRARFPANEPFHLSLQSMDQWAEHLQNPPASTDNPRRTLFCSAFDSDAAEVALLERNGFQSTDHIEPFLTRSLVDLEVIKPPPGVTVRHVVEGDYTKRVEVHRAAWWPSAGFTMDRYLDIRAFAPDFDAELDLIAEDEHGAFGCCAIGWTDPVSQTLFIEPFGTHPDWRGTGISRALLFEMFRRAKAKGMHHVRIYTAGFNHQAISLYTSCGLTLVDRCRTFRKPC